MENITIDIGYGKLTLTENEVAELRSDNIFLQDAILAIINPKVADESDICIESKGAKNYLYEYFSSNRGFSQEFIDKIFE